MGNRICSSRRRNLTGSMRSRYQFCLCHSAWFLMVVYTHGAFMPLFVPLSRPLLYYLYSECVYYFSFLHGSDVVRSYFFYFTRYFRFSFMDELSLLRVSGGETGFISDPFGRGYVGPSQSCLLTREEHVVCYQHTPGRRVTLLI